jgi:hypothetical protein
MKLNLTSVIAVGAWAAVGVCAANADILNFQAELKAAPPGSAAATHERGEVNALLDTDRRLLDYTVRYSGVSGPVNAGFASSSGAAVVVAPASHNGEPIHGVATLTDAQIADLTAGRWVFDIRSSATPQAELKGQVRRVSDF